MAEILLIKNLTGEFFKPGSNNETTTGMQFNDFFAEMLRWQWMIAYSPKKFTKKINPKKEQTNIGF